MTHGVVQYLHRRRHFTRADFNLKWSIALRLAATTKTVTSTRRKLFPASSHKAQTQCMAKIKLRLEDPPISTSSRVCQNALSET